ncbi:hypothetical protein PFLUV_G00083000 [Perca fluviatilis]|uniref:C2H2-type domain-containing protein n=1 Tax=Perca fluviatilis TaxID=8168 RepID=A0A6A5F3A8_PERFL|nr:zinc finger protein 585B-like [Perca fluviatilis]KAF1387730.1 hypothetical protein PFLUV_G00083000 [Perca fluviatilis]
MYSLMMEGGKQRLQNVQEDGLSRDLMDAGRFCFSCEQIFANRKCLEEHTCSAASHICSCGTEFAEYKDMLEHSTTHEPGHQVLDHDTIRKRRIEKRIEEEKQLKRLRTGEVVWETPKFDNGPSISLPVKPMLQAPITSACFPQVPKQSAQISQVPQLYSSMSQASLLPNPNPHEKDMQNIFAGVGAPTVDLWTLYQPVVLLQTVRTFNKSKPYTCGKCGQCFMTKTSLISHHSTHVTDKVSGCIGCGLLLSSKKMVPRFHFCKAPNTATKFRIITARPLNFKNRNESSTHRSPSVQGTCATSSLQLKSQNSTAASEGSRAPLMISNLQFKNQKICTYSKSNQGLHVSPSLLAKGQNHSAYNKTSRGLPVTHSMQFKMATKSGSGVSSKPMQTSSATNRFPCRVCYLPFETPQLLQRHKCVKAQEFMAQHVQGKQNNKLKRVTPVTSLHPVQMNGERKLGFSASDNMKKNMAVVLDKGQGPAPVNGKTDVDKEDDCYIVESGPDKPAEMIYQVTSSVPIKT